MSILKTIFSLGTSKLVETVGNAIDKNITSKEERLILKNEFTKIIQDHEAKIQGELTERHKIDMTSDNKLSKLIRPMTLIYLVIFLSCLVFADSITPINTVIENSVTTSYDAFAVDPAWIKLLTILLVTVFSFYFGGRELQKWLINKKA